MQLKEELLYKYLMGKCTPEEKKIVEAWLEDDSSADTQPSALHKAELAEDMEWIRSKLSQNITEENNSVRSKIHRSSLIYIAAACLLMVIFGSVYLFARKQPGSTSGETIQWSALHNPGKDIRRFSLSDGSWVTLYPGATILVPDKTIGRHRRLKITQGKAYFNIKHDVLSPFTVETGRSTVEVLGTAFIIDRNRLGDAVMLQSGRISFSAPGKTSQILLPGQQVSYDSATGNISITQVAVQQAQPQVNMKFSNAPLRAVFSSMEEKFDIHIELKNTAIGKLKYTGDLTGKSLEDIKAVLSLSAEIQFREYGNTLYVSP